jgi:hypothetical protein
MKEISDMAMKIYHAYEDFLLDKDKKKIFDDLFDKYLSVVYIDGKTDIYDAVVLLGLHHRSEFDQMVKFLKEQSLIID